MDNPSLGQLKFPPGFLWGAATAAHQIEGNNHNDWSVWERANAHRLAATAESRYGHWLPNWEAVRPAATNPENYLSGQAVNNYLEYSQDFDIAQSLGLTAYRCSLEWSRLEPQEGQFDSMAFEHYRDELRALRARGIEPFVTLWHWTLPIWFSEQGGWTSPQAAEKFSRFVGEVVARLGAEITFWITLNEPQVYVAQPFGIDRPPSHVGRFRSLMNMPRQLVAAHKASYHLIKARYPQAQVGIANHQIAFEAYQERWLNRCLKMLSSVVWNDYFLKRIGPDQDFIGVNYYFHNRLHYGRSQNENRVISDLGWELYPEGLYMALTELKKYRLPLYITEHGLADAADTRRGQYLKDSLRAAHRAWHDGADLRGYFHWSLIDNFEWQHGSWPRFGLIGFDYAKRERYLRPSAQVYAEIIKHHGL